MAIKTNGSYEAPKEECWPPYPNLLLDSQTNCEETDSKIVTGSDSIIVTSNTSSQRLEE
jgi:hypothetical protein